MLNDGIHLTTHRAQISDGCHHAYGGEEERSLSLEQHCVCAGRHNNKWEDGHQSSLEEDEEIMVRLDLKRDFAQLGSTDTSWWCVAVVRARYRYVAAGLMCNTWLTAADRARFSSSTILCKKPVIVRRQCRTLSCVSAIGEHRNFP